jgi:CRISPR-associated protein Cst1
MCVLQFTGHALVDVGIATLTALARRAEPDQVSPADLESAADYLARLYVMPGPMRNFACGSVFHNAGYTSSPDADRQRAYCARVLESWRADAPTLPGEACLFCGRPAAYRATRQEVPLLNGLNVFNFGPAGQAGIPICGLCSLAVQALPLGCVKSGRGLIAAHSDDPELTLQLAKAALDRTLEALSLPDAESLPGYPYERTRLVELLIGWLARAERAGRDRDFPASLTGYFFTNGQSPSVRIYPLTANVIGFLERVHHHPDQSLTAVWNRAVARTWIATKRAETDPSLQKNQLYEAIVSLPEQAGQFLRSFLLPTRHWGLVALFAEKVMDMDPERIELLRTLGARFADYARDRRAFFYQFSREENYAKWRRLLLRAADDHARFTGQTLISMDEFVEAFTAPVGEINDWRLARDLVTLALIDARVAGDEPLFDDTDDSDTTDDDHTLQEDAS